MKSLVKFGLVCMLGVSSAMGSFFTVLESGYNEEYKYIFDSDKGTKLEARYEDGRFELKDSIDSKAYDLFVNKEQKSLKSIYSFKKVIDDGLKGKLRVNSDIRILDNGNYYFCSVSSSSKKIDSKIFGNKSLKTIKVKVKESISPKGEELGLKDVAEFYWKGDILAGFKIYSDDDNILYTLSKIDSSEVKEYKEMVQETKTFPLFEDIKDETISMVYRSNKSGNEQRLKVQMSTHPKKDIFSQVNIVGMSKVLSGDTNINQKQNIQAIVHTKSLFQVNGKFSDASKKIVFKASPKKPMIDVVYNGEKKQYSRNKKTPYYNLAGLWLMASDPKKDSVMLFDDSDTPKDFKLKKSSDFISFIHAGKKLYNFRVQNRLVKEFDLSLGGYHFVLEDASTPTVLENRKRLSDFRDKYNIVEIK